jgi:uncharacterized repeat protein (TIGR03803 family)
LSGDGTLFEVNTDGTGFATLHGFTGGSDGVLPEAELILSGNTLYGTALGGGTGSGTVFKVNPDGAGYATVYRFTDRTLSPSGSGQNGDGANPQAGLVLSGNTLYGTASEGGTWNNGTVFKVNTDGTGFRTLHIFSEGHPATNSDGVFPVAGLILSGNTLYGTASEGGAWNSGTVFQVNTNGTGFRTLHNFSAAPNYFQNSDGMVPQAGLILSGNTLYGTASEGGAGGYGTIFSITLPVSPPPLTITASSTNVTLMWPTNAAGFTLQSRTNLASSAVWTAVSAAPVVVNGQNIVTNPISGTQQFYRLQE